MITSDEKVSLINLVEGGAVELFDEELEYVLRNIDNPNMVKEAPRKITLTVTLTPLDTPGMVRTNVGVKSTVAGRKTLQSHMAFGRGARGMEARELVQPKQTQFQNVLEINQEKEAE